MKELLTLRNEQLRLEIETHHLQDTEQDWSDLMKYGEFLDGTVQLYHFIPCKDGNPLEKPENYEAIAKNWEQAKPTAKQMQKCIAYQQAQDAVIFEGWEYVQTGETFYIQNENWGIDWYGSNNPFKSEIRLFPRTNNTFGDIVTAGIKTYSDIAEATQDNPLKMIK